MTSPAKDVSLLFSLGSKRTWGIEVTEGVTSFVRGLTGGELLDGVNRVAIPLFDPAIQGVSPPFHIFDGKVRATMGSTVVQWFNGDHVWPAVSPPCCICPTWLTPDEFDQCLAHHNIQLNSLQVTYRILRNALALAETEHGIGCVRLVLWFDC